MHLAGAGFLYPCRGALPYVLAEAAGRGPRRPTFSREKVGKERKERIRGGACDAPPQPVKGPQLLTCKIEVL